MEVFRDSANATIRVARRRRRHVPTLVGLTAVVAILLAACGNHPAVGDQADAVESAVSSDFPITLYQGADSLGGPEVNLSEVLARGKPVVLNFWAGLCPPCRLEMPDFQAVADEFGEHVVLLGLDVGPFTALGSREDGQALLQELGVSYPTGTTFATEIVREYQLTGMPSTFFIKPNGEITRKWTGILTEDKLAELVEELLAASSVS